MSNINELYRNACDKIPASAVNAYVEHYLNPENLSELVIESSWGESGVDLAPVVKANETLTKLELSPEADPSYIQYTDEAEEPNCISGDDLSKIISVTKLRDVDGGREPADGDTLVYDNDLDKFVYLPLESSLSALEQRIADLEFKVAKFERMVRDLSARIDNLEQILTRPDGVPSDTSVTWGNINEYSDRNNTGSKSSGFYTHNPNNDKANDERFA